MNEKTEGAFDEFSLRDFRRLLDSGELSSSTLVRYYLDRIEKLDRSGPRLKAVLHLEAEALAAAETRDREREGGKARGLLHGIPILIKANIDVASPSLPTTAGSLALRDRVASSDAPLVAELRKAGAIVLGTTNLSEWANFRSKRSSSGWSSEGGQTRNPYALDRNPSGSSSGSAVAVSANLCAAAVGTETDGSIVSPASANGVVGIKPTLGLVSGRGIIPIAASQDTAGPMARRVEDAGFLLAAMAGARGGELSDFLAAGRGREGLAGYRLGIARGFAGFDSEVDRLFESSLALLRELGAELIETDFAPRPELEEAEFELMLYEFKAGIEAYLREHGKGDGLEELSDLIAFNEAHAAEVMPWFGQELFLMAAAKGPLTEEGYLTARKACLSLARNLDASLAGSSLDAFVAPSGGPAWKTDYYLGDNHRGGCATPAAVAGYPHLSLPAGLLHGLPVGLSIFGPAFGEKKLLEIALAFERAGAARRKPSFAPTLDAW